MLTKKINFFFVFYEIFNGPSEARAVLQTPPSLILKLSKSACSSRLIHWLSNHFPPNLHNTRNPKPFELGTYHFDTMFTTRHLSIVMCHVSCVMGQVSNVMCHMSHVTCPLSHNHFLTNWWSYLVKGLLKMGHTPSSFYWTCVATSILDQQWCSMLNGAIPIPWQCITKEGWIQ